MNDLDEMLCLSEGREPPRCPICDAFMEQDMFDEWHCQACADKLLAERDDE